MLSVSSRLCSAAAAAVALSGLLLCSGCGKSTADAQVPPPQSLSEPVRPEPAPTTAPALPVSSSTDDYAVQKKGESRALPAFVEPAPTPMPAPAAAVAVQQDPTAAAGGRYHVLAKGETLYALSRKYNVKVGKIIQANQFKDPNHLAIGTKVYIPN